MRRSPLFLMALLLATSVGVPAARAADGLTELSVIDQQVGTGAVAYNGREVEVGQG